MSSSKKSKTDRINIEDLIDDEATVEDFEEYNQIYPDLDAVPQLKNHCTSCFKHLGLSLAAVPKIRLHNVLKVTICKTCHEFYNSGEFERGSDGSELFCRWCGQGGVVVCCTKCIYVFCKECIKRNLGSSTFKKIMNDNQWSCFRCDSSQLINLRARHHVFTNYLLNRQNHVNVTARNAVELKTLLLEDMSTCCRQTAFKSPVKAATVGSIEPPVNTESDGSDSINPIPSSQPPLKRARALSPGSAPGPLSKKLKRKADLDALANKPSSSKISPAPQPPQVIEDNDEPDLMSLMTPIVELEEQHTPADESESVDPLQMDMPISSNPPRIPTSINRRPPTEMPPLKLAFRPATMQEVEPDPMSLQFGGHFMDPSPLPQLLPPSNVNPGLPSPPIKYQIWRNNGPRMNVVANNNNSNRIPMAPRQFLPRPSVFRINRLPAPVVSTPRPVVSTPRPVVSTPRPVAVAPAGNDNVFHYVNGYKIDLRAASEKQLIKLPDGKVIHVRRHAGAQSLQLSVDPTSSGSLPTRPPIFSPTTSSAISMQMPANLTIRYQPPHINPLSLRTPNMSLAPRPTLQPIAMQRSMEDAIRPRRKTTLRPRMQLNSTPNFSQIPSPHSPAGRKTLAISSKTKVSAMVQKLLTSLTHFSNKCKKFTTTNLYKNTKTVEDVCELHTNLSYIISYACSGLNEIKMTNDKLLEELKSSHVKEQPNTEDILLLEDRPMCINLDSDSEGEEKIVKSPPKTQAGPIIRCKTVLEINKGESITDLPPKRDIPIVEKKNMTNSVEIHVNNVITLDESDEEAVSEDNETIVRGLLDEILGSLFSVQSDGDDKENKPPKSESEKLISEDVTTNDKVDQGLSSEESDLDRDHPTEIRDTTVKPNSLNNITERSTAEFDGGVPKSCQVDAISVTPTIDDKEEDIPMTSLEALDKQLPLTDQSPSLDGATNGPSMDNESNEKMSENYFQVHDKEEDSSIEFISMTCLDSPDEQMSSADKSPQLNGDSNGPSMNTETNDNISEKSSLDKEEDSSKEIIPITSLDAPGEQSPPSIKSPSCDGGSNAPSMDTENNENTSEKSLEGDKEGVSTFDMPMTSLGAPDELLPSSHKSSPLDRETNEAVMETENNDKLNELDHSIEDVISVLETISKEIGIRSDSEDGISSNNLGNN